MAMQTMFRVSARTRLNPAVEAIDPEGAAAETTAEDAPKGGIGLKQEDAMKLRICRLIAIAAFVSCVLASTETPAQELAYVPYDRLGHDSCSVSIIDAVTNELITDSHLLAGSHPFGVAAGPGSFPGGGNVYFTNQTPTPSL
jgi:hypothetical protein